MFNPTITYKIRYFIFILTILFFNIGYGCQCNDKNSSSIESYNSSKVIFKGEVFSIKNVEINNVKFDEISFVVNKNYKGISNTKVIIYQNTGSNCNVDFIVGQEWFVWANNWDNLLYTSICTNSANAKTVSKKYIDFLEEISKIDEYKIWYDENGDKIAEGLLSKTLASGFWKYYKYGFLFSEGLYEEGLKNDKWITYYDVFPYVLYSQKKEFLTDLYNDKNSSRFRQKKEIVNYKKGLKNGIYKYYNLSGSIRYSSIYADDKQNGTMVVYGQNEMPKNIYNYKSDILDGMYISFFEDGTVELLCNYKNGQQFGDWKLFNKEGEVVCSSRNTNNFPQYSSGKYNCKEN